ncbi:adenosine deaminase-like protein [Ischnura elegans]|uniref:adenosine deaminase-like protein n=1 Tax=Ischnura elegans TaxID=197161 RepID=UPI001ED8B631|nr:adenosine deaminase-like protein [Ischnura elegans]
MMNEGLLSFCEKLPKVELHAHLNGSISDETLLELSQASGLPEEELVELHNIVKNMKCRSLKECFKIFDIIHKVTVKPSIIRRAAMDVIKDFANDGVVYLELRSTPRRVEGSMTKKEYINAVIDSIRESRNIHPIIVKLIISIDRKAGVLEAEENLQLAIEAKEIHPDIVVGVDFSGNPAIGAFDGFIPVLEKAHKSGFPLALHCAEVPSVEETENILNLKPERLGHGTCFHPDAGGTQELWNALISAKIPVELCLTSNVMTATVKDYKNHHFDYLYKHGHPIVLGTDDKGVFSTSLSAEYCIAAKTFELNNDQLWQLSYDSINYAFASDYEKEKLREIFKEWKQKLLNTA